MTAKATAYSMNAKTHKKRSHSLDTAKKDYQKYHDSGEEFFDYIKEERHERLFKKKATIPKNQSTRPIKVWEYNMTGHAAACVEKYLELSGQSVKLLPKVTHPCIDDHQLTESDYQNKGNLHASAARIVLKCLFQPLPLPEGNRGGKNIRRIFFPPLFPSGNGKG